MDDNPFVQFVVRPPVTVSRSTLTFHDIACRLYRGFLPPAWWRSRVSSRAMHTAGSRVDSLGECRMNVQAPSNLPVRSPDIQGGLL